MKRRIIHIEESRCNGCGLCAAACHEGAIEMVNGKARLTREDYCDGLGDCLPACPTGAITFEEREAPAYDHAAVLAAKAARAADTPLPCGCPGSQSRAIRRPEAAPTAGDIPSELRQWPVQIKLAPVNAPYFDGCDLLIAADCTAAVSDTLVPRTMEAARRTGYGKVAVAGGVAANSRIRADLERACRASGHRLYLPALSLCGDNGAMIGCQAYYEYQAGRRGDLALNAYATRSIEQG